MTIFPNCFLKTLLLPSQLICYLRIGLIIIGIDKSFSEPLVAFIFVFISFLLDAVDGKVARWTKTETNFGLWLDMLIDRAFSCIAYTLVALGYPRLAIFMIAIMLLDLGSHAVLMLIKGDGSHKTRLLGHNRLLDIYYLYRPFMFTLIMMNYLFWAALFIAKSYPNLLTLKTSLILLSPSVIILNTVHVIQFIYAYKIWKCRKF